MFLMIGTKMLPDSFLSKRSCIQKEVKSVAINATSIKSYENNPLIKGRSERILVTVYRSLTTHSVKI